MKAARFLLVLTITCLMLAGRAQGQLGTRLAFSTPTGSAGIAADVGINAAVTATTMNSPTAGVVMEVGYHRWPGSSYVNTAFDEFLSRVGGAPITGTKWTLSALQAAGYVKVVPPLNGPVMPWIQVGMSMYRVNRNLKLPADQLRAAGFQVLKESSDSITYVFGYVGGVGFDFETSTRMRFGFDASYHYLLWKEDSAHFTAFTFGVHLVR